MPLKFSASGLLTLAKLVQQLNEAAKENPSANETKPRPKTDSHAHVAKPRSTPATKLAGPTQPTDPAADSGAADTISRPADDNIETGGDA